MILGIGADILDIRRLERVLERHGDRFLLRVFTAVEREKAARRTERIRVATLAKRWAAKEACAKALGTGFSDGVFHSDLGVVNLPSGQPTMVLTGGALARLGRLAAPGRLDVPGSAPRIHLTMTDEPPYAYAEVVIEA